MDRALSSALDDQDLAQTLLDLNATVQAGNSPSSLRPQILAGTFQPGAAPRIGAEYQVADLPAPKNAVAPPQNGHAQ